jgi:PiT family inorganic phosphate transporter
VVGLFNFLGVLLSSGAVAFGIIALLPVELILQVGSSAGFAMIFALLIAAILWNLGTWWLGLPASSSHTLIGSIIGVGVANALMHGRDGTSGVDWSQAIKIGYALLLSPLIGFLFAALAAAGPARLREKPCAVQGAQRQHPATVVDSRHADPHLHRCVFAHGSNDGQKGMGLIMLILVGTLPMAYALNRAMPAEQSLQFAAVAEVTQVALVKSVPQALPGTRVRSSTYVRTKDATPELIPALAALAGQIGEQVKGYGSLAKVPAESVGNVRNDMYLTSETIRLMDKGQVGISTPTPRQAATVQATDRQRHALHPAVGEDRRGHRPGAGDHGRLETHRGDGGRENRQDPPDLRPGRLGRNRGDADHRRGGHVRPAGVDHPCAVVRCGRDHGRQWRRRR